MATNNGTLIKTYEILKMKNKNKVQFQKLTERFQKIRKKLFEEWKLKYPSYYPLESCATDIVQLLKETQIEDEEFEFWKSWKIREIDIFKADLVGELHHDYDKRLVRLLAWVLALLLWQLFGYFINRNKGNPFIFEKKRCSFPPLNKRSANWTPYSFNFPTGNLFLRIFTLRK